MKRVVTFGEVMLRLKSPGLERFFQSPALEATFGGAEANVAVSLANYGLDPAFVTALPKNVLADAALAELRGLGVDTQFVRRQGERMGIYFLEGGANQRASKVVYDRSGSSISTARPGDFDWEKIFAGADWFHISGVTPAISASAAELSIAGAQYARAHGITVSVDYNYRKNLWKYGKKAPEAKELEEGHLAHGDPVNPADGTPEAEQAAAEHNRAVIEQSTLDDWLPGFTRGGASGALLDCDDVRRPALFSGLGVLSVLTLDLAGDLQPTSTTGLMASGEAVYASTSRLFVTTGRWDWSADALGSTVTTEVHGFDIAQALDPARKFLAADREADALAE